MTTATSILAILTSLPLICHTLIHPPIADAVLGEELFEVETTGHTGCDTARISMACQLAQTLEEGPHNIDNLFEGHGPIPI